MADLDSCRAAYRRELAATRARYRRAIDELGRGFENFALAASTLWDKNSLVRVLAADAKRAREREAEADQAYAGLRASIRPFWEVLEERNRQDMQWGEQNHHPGGWCVVLLEEAGEAAKGALEQDYANYREEMIQVAAVAIAAVESLDRDRWHHTDGIERPA